MPAVSSPKNAIFSDCMSCACEVLSSAYAFSILFFARCFCLLLQKRKPTNNTKAVITPYCKFFVLCTAASLFRYSIKAEKSFFSRPYFISAFKAVCSLCAFSSSYAVNRKDQSDQHVAQRK